MGVAETVLIYLTIGVVVAASCSRIPGLEPSPTIGTRVLWMGLWPFFAPSLLGGEGGASEGLRPEGERTLLEALHSLGDRLPRAVLEENEARILAVSEGLRSIRRQQEELAQILALPELNAPEAMSALADLRGRGLGDDDPRVRSVVGRIANIDQLKAMGERLDVALEVATLSMDQLRGQIRLLRFTDAPEVELSRLISEVSVSVESLTRSLDV